MDLTIKHGLGLRSRGVRYDAPGRVYTPLRRRRPRFSGCRSLHPCPYRIREGAPSNMDPLGPRGQEGAGRRGRPGQGVGVVGLAGPSGTEEGSRGGVRRPKPHDPPQ